MQIASAPAWVTQMQTGRWYRISGDHPDLNLPAAPGGHRYLADGDPALDPRLNPPRDAGERLRRLLGRRPHAPWSGRVGFSAITEAWNGAVLATGVGPAGAMIVFGGGHDDYFGSDVHSFDLASRQWSRIADGFTSGGAGDYGDGAIYPAAVYPDGSPLPPHTYGYVQYDPEGNNFILFKGQTQLGPNVQAIAIPHLFNLDTLSWRHGPQHPNGRFNSGGWTAWDSERRVIWGHSGDDGGGNGLSWYCPDGDNGDGTVGRWGPLYSNKLPGRANHNAMALDPGRDLLLVTDHVHDRLWTLDAARPESQLAPVHEQGRKFRLGAHSGLEYSERLGGFLYFATGSGSAIHLLRPPGEDEVGSSVDIWRWALIGDPDGALDPIADAACISSFETSVSHVFGRFRVITHQEAEVAILIRHVDTPVYAMRLG